MGNRFDHSDTGNAELLVSMYGKNTRYDSSTARWLQWRDTHRWYEIDRTTQYEMAINTANYRFESAKSLNDTEDIKREVLFGIKSRDLRRLENMLTIAENLRPIGGHGIAWDSYPNLLAVDNGVIDLQTGSFKSGARTDYISTGLSIPYIPHSPCPRWERFITEICCGDTELSSFIQRAIGYTLSGYVREHVFFLLYGSGGNGKSVLVNALGHLLAGFSRTIRFTAFEENGTTDAKRDLAELPGVRATFASEGAELKGLDTAMIKQITGGEPITTSKKYGHPFTYKPQFKLWLTTNHLPRIDDDSYGFWRRVILIPFNAKFEGAARENDLEDKLIKELPGILAWAVEGAKAWFKSGLSTPDSLLLQIQSYRQAEDEIENFILDCCQLSPHLKEKASQLYSAYVTWKIAKHERPLSSTLFGRRLNSKYEKEHDRTGWWYQGLALDTRIKV